MLDLVSQVLDVVLMNVYLDLGNSGGSGFWNGGYMNQGREMGIRGGWILSQQGGFQVSKGGTNGEQKGMKKSKKQGDYSELL